MRDAEGVDESGEEQIDVQHIKDMLGFIVKAPSRRKFIALAVFLPCALIAVFIATSVFKNYRVGATILLQKNVPIQGIANPIRDQRREESAAEGMVEQMLKHESMLGLVRGCHFADRGKPTSTLGTIKESIKSIFSSPKPTSLADLEDGYVLLLSSRFSVTTDGSQISILTDWWDEHVALDIVDLAVRNFFRDREAAEISPVEDAIKLLKDHAETARKSVDEALEEFERAKQAGGKASPPTTTVVSRAPRTAAKDEIDAELTQSLDEKRRQIHELEADHNRRLDDLKSQLAKQLATFTPAHPAVVALQSQVDAASHEPAALTQLKKEERALLDQIASKKLTPSTASPGGDVAVVSGTPKVDHRLDSIETLSLTDPTSGLALSKLQSRVHNYGEFMDRIATANLELDAAKAAFKYRYSIFKPVEVLSKPRRIVTLLVVAVGILIAMALACIAAALADLAGGRLLETWQVKRLGVRFIGEITKL